jgi:hypothetical protein
MAKKIATPRKTAPKIPARKISKAKAIGAPKAYKPKGSAKEKLAYLNKGEMAALVKKKGSPARKGPRGLPSFADDSASSKGVSRGDTYGTKGSGSTKTATGSVSKSTESRSSPSGAGRGQGGQGGYNSGTSGSRFGGASTQKPGMGRNAGRVSPQSPMAGQGTSFATNKAARDDTLRRAYGIEDERGLQNMPQQLNWDVGNPNLPAPDYDKWARDRLAERDAENREIARNYGDDYMTPGEIRAQADRWKDSFNNTRINQKQRSMGLDDIRSRMPDSAFTNAYKSNSSRVPDIKLGGPRSGSSGDGFSGGGMGGTFRGGGWGENSNNNGRGGSGWKAGGLVKKNSNKSFKKK